MKTCGTLRWMTALLVAGMASLSIAQELPAAAKAGGFGRGGFGFAAALEKRIGLSPEQRDAVRGLLAEQRQKTQSVREETDAKIRAVLNAEQQKKFDSMLAEQKANRRSKK